MSGAACSFWQKVLMAALSKVLVQVTEQSILRWMRKRDRVREWESERGKRERNRKVISTFRNTLHICSPSFMIAGFQVKYRQTLSLFMYCRPCDSLSTDATHHCAASERKPLRVSSCSQPFFWLTITTQGAFSLPATSSPQSSTEDTMLFECNTYWKRLEKLTCYWLDKTIVFSKWMY